MARSNRITLSLIDPSGLEWVNIETTETKARAIIRAYKTAGVTLHAKFAGVTL